MSVQAKLDRAQDHFEGLHVEVVTFGERKPYRLVRQANADKTEHTLALHFVERPPVERWGVILGDGIQALRSALDHLVYAIAVHESGLAEPPAFDKLMFPITDAPDTFNQIKWRIKTLSQHVRTAIEQLQPYRHDLDTSPLWVVEKLNRSDKHRVIHLATVRPARGAIPISGLVPGTKYTADWRLTGLEDGAPFFTLTCAVPSPDVQMDIDLNMYVSVEWVRRYGEQPQYPPIDPLLALPHEVTAIAEQLAAVAGL